LSAGSIIEYASGDLVDEGIQSFIQKLREHLDLTAVKTESRTDPQISGKPDPGWELLNKADFMSARQFLRV